MCIMNITLAIDEQLVERAREKAGAQGKSLNDYIRESLQRLAGDDDVKARMARFRSISGKGNSNGWKFNREEIYDRS
jgi:hypothetical protein